jgi:pimeloyl-ACP methyl ester carboxylesterase
VPALAALAPLASALDLGLPLDLLDNPLYGAPDNDFSCRSEAHPNPVIMLHGMVANREVDLNQLSWEMQKAGYCVFSETYGAHTLVPWVGGLKDMRESAADIAAFIREVRDNTGAEKVDLVGHSEGGVMAVYVPMTQEGIADMVDHNIALGPAIHGAQYFGFTDLFYIGGDATRSLVGEILELVGVPAADDMATDGNIYNDFKNASPIAQPGNKLSVIMSDKDTLVAPEVSRVDEDGVRNIMVQQFCPDDPVGHAGLAWDKGVWEIILNELNENYNAPVTCDSGLPF